MPTVTIDRTIIHYEERGERNGSTPPIVLIHGFPLDGRIFDAQLDGLSSDARVIVPDLPSFGKSPSESAFSIESLANDTHALLQKIDALPCVLGGLSMGGYVAQAFAKKYPRDLVGLMLLATKSEADTAEGKEKRNKMIEQVRTGGSKAIADAMFPNMITKEPAARPEIGGKLRDIMEACPAITIAHALAAMRDREDYRSMLPSLPMPVLIIAGEHDQIASKQTIESMAGAIPRSHVVMLRDAAHIVTMEKPQEVNDAIRLWRGRLAHA